MVTPAHEVGFCGHATLATARALVTKAAADAGAPLVFHTRVGQLRVSKVRCGYRPDLPRLPPEPLDALPAEIAGALDKAPVGLFRNFENIFADLGSADAVRRFVPELAAIARLGPWRRVPSPSTIGPTFDRNSHGHDHRPACHTR